MKASLYLKGNIATLALPRSVNKTAKRLDKWFSTHVGLGSIFHLLSEPQSYKGFLLKIKTKCSWFSLFTVSLKYCISSQSSVDTMDMRENNQIVYQHKFLAADCAPLLGPNPLVENH